jgi:hypothetical protein
MLLDLRLLHPGYKLQKHASTRAFYVAVRNHSHIIRLDEVSIPESAAWRTFDHLSSPI